LTDAGEVNLTSTLTIAQIEFARENSTEIHAPPSGLLLAVTQIPHDARHVSCNSASKRVASNKISYRACAIGYFLLDGIVVERHREIL